MYRKLGTWIKVSAKGLGKYFSQILMDVDGWYSSKRFVGIFGSIALFVAFFINMFAGFHFAHDMFNGLRDLVMACLGMSAAEKFSPYNKSDLGDGDGGSKS